MILVATVAVTQAATLAVNPVRLGRMLLPRRAPERNTPPRAQTARNATAAQGVLAMRHASRIRSIPRPQAPVMLHSESAKLQ